MIPPSAGKTSSFCWRFLRRYSCMCGGAFACVDVLLRAWCYICVLDGTFACAVVLLTPQYFGWVCNVNACCPTCFLLRRHTSQFLNFRQQISDNFYLPQSLKRTRIFHCSAETSKTENKNFSEKKYYFSIFQKTICQLENNSSAIMSIRY